MVTLKTFQAVMRGEISSDRAHRAIDRQEKRKAKDKQARRAAIEPPEPECDWRQLVVSECGRDS